VRAQLVAEEEEQHDESDDPQRETHGDDPCLVDLDRFGVRSPWLLRHGSTIGTPGSGRLAASTSGRAASELWGGCT
jgi:hypothetical protein